MNYSLSLPAWELKATNEGTDYATDRMCFLKRVEECGRNKTFVDAGRAWVHI